MPVLRTTLLDPLRQLFARQPAGRSKLVVGLGNPGRQYAMTRHNVGFWCVDHLAEEWSISMSGRRRHAAIWEGEIDGVPVALAKPRTYVNKSGAAVTSLMARYRATAEDLLVIYDDMDLAAGKLRLRARGSAGGHNGMRSIVGALGTQDFVRLRIGIGRPRPGLSGMARDLR